jgi:hypothetical protein
MNTMLSLLSVGVTLLFVIGVFVWISVRLRRGGGSLTTTVLGATDGFLSAEKSKAAETIVNENAGKRFEGERSEQPKEELESAP